MQRMFQKYVNLFDNFWLNFVAIPLHPQYNPVVESPIYLLDEQLKCLDT